MVSNTSAQTAIVYDDRTPVGTRSAVPTPTLWLTGTPTFTVTSTPTATSTVTQTPTPTFTRTATPTRLPTYTPSLGGPAGGPGTPTADGPPFYTVGIDITADQDQYFLTDQATMPGNIVLRPNVSGFPDAIVDQLHWVWSYEIDYVPSDYDLGNGPPRNIHYRWPLKSTDGLDPFTPDFGDVVRGGTLTVTASTRVNGLLYEGRTTKMILGSNPSNQVLASYFASQFPNSYYTLWRIAGAESNMRQFTDGGHPRWSSDGKYGVGMMQITAPAPTDDEVWSWKRNVDAGSRVLQSAYATARDWPRNMADSPQFRTAVDDYNAQREELGLPRLSRVTVPDFTSGNLLCNLQQRELNAIRLYNGAGGSDDLGRPLHEYRLAYDASLKLLDLQVDEQELVGTAKWVQVPPSERPQGSGAADYVSRVLSRPAPGGAC